jgi:hypothetical protein
MCLYVCPQDQPIVNGRASNFSFAISGHGPIQFPRLFDPSQHYPPRIVQEHLCEGDASDSTLDSKWMNAQFRSHQIFYLQTIALYKRQMRLLIEAITRGFNLQPKDIRHALQKGDAIPKGRG